MRSAIRYVVMGVLASGCASENGVRNTLPKYPPSEPRPVDNVTQTDVLVQATTPKSDVLWAIDDSCSMNCVVGCHEGSLADKITENFGIFMDYMKDSGMDYHIGVITLDMDDPTRSGKLVFAQGQKYIDPNTYDPIEVFTQIASQGTDGSGMERGFGSTYAALEINKDTYNAGYYREDATLHTVVLSNEDDHTQSNLITPAEFVDWYEALKPTAKDRTFSSLVCTRAGIEICAEGRADAYARVTDEIGGIVWDIENEDWTELLHSLGEQAAGLKREYYLSRIPVSETIDLSVKLPEGAVLKFQQTYPAAPDQGDYAYDPARNSIVFHEFVPPSLSQVIITYTVRSSLQEPTESDVTAPVE